MKNPLLENWTTPFQAPPFNIIEIGHYLPAINNAIEEARAETDKICDNTATPDFENTIAALDRTGERLGRITAVLYNLNSAETNKELQSVAQEVSPLLTRFSNDITLNSKLFERIRIVYEGRKKAGLNEEQLILTERKYHNFLLGGAALKENERERFRTISEELSVITLRFEENILAETNSFELHITDEADLEGLPQGIIESASAEAHSRNKNGWVFTLNFPSYIPFMQYSAKRHLREKMLKAYGSRAFKKNENDNRELINRIVALRIELSKMLGFDTYADMILEDRMASSPSQVNDFLNKLYTASLPAARRDYDRLVDYARSLGHNDRLERYDWAYYAEKLKKKLYDIDDEILKPYFVLENTEKAIFDLAGKLYGLKFIRNNNIPVYNPEVKTFEVYDNDDRFLSVLYTDYHPRPGKNGGAWMTSYREQSVINGNDIRPLVSIVANFTRPGSERPSLLSFHELTTFLHEFGHALHGMLSHCTYESLSGTNVARDFVELPSQFMENFAYEKEWLDTWAFHYKTGEKIPGDLLKKIKESAVFNEGYACLRQLSFGFLDMAWHNLALIPGDDISSFEREAIAKTELFPPIDGSNISASFAHIFSGGYAAGYYGYKWAEVLDADAFSYFTETGIFNKETAASFRKNILEKGASAPPDKLYKTFRGKEPSIDAFLIRSGLI